MWVVVFHIPLWTLVEGRRAVRGAGAEPERLATKTRGMSGPVRIQEQNRTEARGSYLVVSGSALCVCERKMLGPVLLCRSHALAPQVSEARWTMQAARVNSARQLTHYAYGHQRIDRDHDGPPSPIDREPISVGAPSHCIMYTRWRVSTDSAHSVENRSILTKSTRSGLCPCTNI